MEPAFWDSSCIVPAIVIQQTSLKVKELTAAYRMVVGWTAPIEVRGGVARLARMGRITPREQVQALILFDQLRSQWREVALGPAVREKAEDFVERFPLRAADALQLGAAWAWCQGHPRNRPFISSDAQLLDAAREMGFHIIQP